MCTRQHPMRKRACLMSTALVMVLPTLAFAQERPSTEANWSLDVRLTYSDNYRRLPEEMVRTDIVLVTPDDEMLPSFQGTTALTRTSPDDEGTLNVVSVEPPDNIIVSIGTSGSALMRRPNFSGIISGSLRIGAYLENDPINEVLLNSASTMPPATNYIIDRNNFDPMDPTYVEGEVIGSSFSLSDTDDVFIDPNISTSGTWSVVDDLFYVDVSALAAEQSLGQSNFLVQEGIGQADEEVIYGGVSVSPYLYRQFANEGSLELRVRANSLQVLDEQVGDSLDLGDGVTIDDIQFSNDSTSTEAMAQYSSGNFLSKLKFSLGASTRKVEETGSDVPQLVPEVDLTQSSASLDTTFELSDSFSLLAGIGYDDVDFGDNATAGDTTRADNYTGEYWNVGFNYVPSQRSSLLVKVGERYDGASLTVRARHRLTRRVDLMANADRTLSTGTQDFANGVFTSQSSALQILNRLSSTQDRTSSDLLDRALAFEGAGFTNVQRGQFGVGTVDRYSLGLRGNFQRTNVSLGASYSESDFNNNDTTYISYNASVQRQVSRRLSVGASGRFVTNETDRTILTSGGGGVTLTDDRVDQQYYSLNVNYQVGAKLNISGQVYHSENERDRSFTGGTRFAYEENAASLGLSWQF